MTADVSPPQVRRRSIFARLVVLALAGAALAFAPAASAVAGASVSDATVSEGQSGMTPAVFVVTLSESDTRTVTIEYATSAGGSQPATPGTDFVSETGTVTFAPGDTSEQIVIDVIGDGVTEPDETFLVQLSNPSPGDIALSDSTGVGTIVNDDNNTLRIDDSGVTEGSGPGSTSFVISLQRSAGDARTVAVDYFTIPAGFDPAEPGSDFVSETGTVTFPTGTADTRTVTIEIIGDEVRENDETFEVRLTDPVNAVVADGTGIATIFNDDVSFAGGGGGGAIPSPQPSPTSSASATTSPPAASSSPPTGATGCSVGGPTRVTLRVDVNPITAGNAPTLAGTATDAAGRPCADTRLTVFTKSSGQTAYSALATVSTDSTGLFTLVVRPVVQTSYGANTAGNAVRSNVVNIRVFTRVDITSPTPASPARAVTNPVTFSGNLVPGYSNIAVGLGQLLGGRFVVLQQTRADAAGRYSITRSLPRGRGIYVIFVSAVAQGTDKGSRSITLDVG